MSWQAAFAGALQKQGPAPPGLGDARRFGIYRNNSAAGLAAALAVRYPAAQRLTGDEFFKAMAREFAREHLPASAALINWGADFPDFIASFAPAAGVPYLADTARLESAWWRAYHAADAAPLAAAAFAAIPAEGLAETRFRFHPSASVLQSPFAFASILLLEVRSLILEIRTQIRLENHFHL